MSRLRNIFATALAIGLLGTAPAAFADGAKHIKGVLEKVDVPANRIVVRETHGKHVMPLGVEPDTKITTPSGKVSLGALHVGDGVSVSVGPGATGEVAREIEVTTPAAPE